MVCSPFYYEKMLLGLLNKGIIFNEMHLLNGFDLIFQWTRLHMSFPIRR